MKLFFLSAAMIASSLIVAPIQCEAGPLRAAARIASAPVRAAKSRSPVRSAVKAIGRRDAKCEK